MDDHADEDLCFPLPALEVQPGEGWDVQEGLKGSHLAGRELKISNSTSNERRLIILEDVNGQHSALGYVAVHPDKKRPELWDAAAALSQGGLLKLKVIQVRAEQQVNEGVQQQPQVLEVACSGSLVLPAYTTEPPPLGRSPLAAAIHIIIQHIATLGQEPSDLSADTNVHGMEELDVTSGEGDVGAEAPAEEMDLRDRIYEMLRPVDWTAEATEPSGLTCTLRGYQRRALAWMARREALGDGSDPSSSTAGGPSATAGSSQPPAAHQQPVWNGTHHPCWQRVAMPSGESFYHNWDTGQLQKAPPFAPQPLSGGALADEMGLGKTVITLALILKRPPPAGWRAPLALAQPPPTPTLALPHASTPSTLAPLAQPPQTPNLATPGATTLFDPAPSAQTPLGSQGLRRNGATLIAATPALLGQWDNEIKQHAPLLKVVIYDGLKASSKAGGGDGGGSPEFGKKRKRKMTKRQKFEVAQEVWETQRQAFEAAKLAGVPVSEEAAFQAQMERLMAADVVLVAYPTLSQEVHHARNALGVGRSLRRPKRYNVVDSPLTALHWWRLILDEAQNVGDGFSQVGDMAALLRARSRWVVTGTPMGNGGLRDLHGLLRVLRHDPFSDRRLWRTCVEHPCLRDDPHALERLEAVLKPIMWRNDKASVGDELDLKPRTLERVTIIVSEGERSFYHSVQNAAAPAHEALMLHAAAANDNSEEAGPSSPRTLSRVEAARAVRAARAAEEAAVSAVLDLRKCCDHPQLTSMWRRQGREGQLAQGIILSIGEQNQRRADELQNKLQASERNLCVLLNTLAAMLLEDPGALGSPTSPKHKGKGKQKAAADGDETPQGPDRKRRKSEATEAAAGPSWEERRAEALALLRKSRLISEEGIGATWGEPATDIKAASAAIRAWRPIQVSVLEQLADLLEASGVPRNEDEDLPAMREEARRKLEEIDEVPRAACMEREVRLAELSGKLEEAGRKVAELWRRAHAAGWQERRRADGSEWCAVLLSRYDAAKAADDEATAEAGQVQSAVTELLQPEEERLIEMRAVMEGVCVTPLVATALHNAQTVLSALHGLSRQAPNSALVEVMADIPEQRMLRLAREGSTLNRALVAAHALRRLHPIDTLDYQKAVSSVRKVVNALRKEHDKLLQRRSQHAGILSDDNDPEAAIAALEAVCAQLDFLRGLRERHAAEKLLEIDRHNLGVAEEEAHAASAAVSRNTGRKSAVVIRREIEELQSSCRSLLSQQRFLRSTAPEQPELEHIGNAGPLVTERQLPEPAAAPGSWPAGVRARTGLSAALGSWQVPLAAPHRANAAAHRSNGASQTADMAGDFMDLTYEPAGPTACSSEEAVGQLPSARPPVAAPFADVGGAEGLAAAPQPEDEAMPDAAECLGGSPQQLQDQDGSAAGDMRNTAGRSAAEEDIVSPGRATRTDLERLRSEKHARWLEQQGRGRSGDGAGPSSRGEAASGAAGRNEQEASVEGTRDNMTGGISENAVAADGALSGSRADMEESGRAKGTAKCGICWSYITSAMLMPKCGHFMCVDCWPKWSAGHVRKAKCYICREEFTFSNVTRAPIASQSRDAVVRDDPKYQQVAWIGQWGSKIEALVRRLLWLREHHPEIKSLVFSQWQGALFLVSKALDAQDPPIKHVALTGTRHRGQGPREVIKTFNDNADVRVFLLTRGQGAAGLTLTQASHVFLLEPSVSVAVEQQALARVHRFGQTRPVRITRFISQHTVEEEVVRVAEATQSLLSEDSSNPAGLLQKAEDVSTGQVRRLLDAAMRQRPASAAEGDGAPGLPVSA